MQGLIHQDTYLLVYQKFEMTLCPTLEKSYIKYNTAIKILF